MLALTAAVAAVGVLLIVDLGAPGGSGEFRVSVIGPDEVLFNGTVEVADATAYTVLLAAAEAGGFEVAATGSGQFTFVHRIGAHENEGRSGWCYAVWTQQWTYPERSAAIQPLHDGQASRWVYSNGPERCS